MLKFRDDINLLRALAVIFVVLFHFKIPYIHNGFAGVDIFFVISGYLMTAIIFRDFGNNLSWHKIVKTFYLRRFSRIVPALLALVVILWIFSYFEIFNFVYQRIVREIAFATAFFSNVNYFRHTGYFDIEASRKWLLHTWSLSVEMQFYIFYPLVLIVAKKILGVSKVKWVVLLLFVASLASSIYYAKINPSHAYYLLDTRAWQLLAGGVVFLFPLKFKGRNAKVVQYLAVLLLIVFIFLPSFESDWMGVVTLVPIIFAMLLLYSNSSTTLSKNVALKYLGLWSYSLYLWHWVIVAYLHYLQVFDLWYIKLFGIAVSVLFSAVSYYTIERKFRYKIIIIFILFIGVIIASNYVHKHKISSEKSVNLKSIFKENRKYFISHLSRYRYNKNDKYILVGDSHALSILDLLIKKHKTLSYITAGEDLFITDKEYNLPDKFLLKKNIANNKKLFYIIKNYNNKDKTFFIIQAWNIYKKTDNFFVKLQSFLELTSKKFKRVVILLDVPKQEYKAIDIYRNSYIINKNIIDKDRLYNSSISLKEYKKQQKEVNSFIRKVASKYKNVIILDPTPYVCDKHRCSVGTDKINYYLDDNHLSNAGALKLLPLFEPFFKEAKK